MNRGAGETRVQLKLIREINVAYADVIYCDLILWSIFVGDDGLFTHGRNHRHNQFFPFVKVRLNFIAQFAVGHAYIVLGRTVLRHQPESTPIHSITHRQHQV